MSQTITDTRPDLDLEEDDDDEVVHWGCCMAPRWEQLGQRIYAFCGVDLTEMLQCSDGTIAEGALVCEPCQRVVNTDRDGGGCNVCPQDLFGKR